MRPNTLPNSAGQCRNDANDQNQQKAGCRGEKSASEAGGEYNRPGLCQPNLPLGGWDSRSVILASWNTKRILPSLTLGVYDIF